MADPDHRDRRSPSRRPHVSAAAGLPRAARSSATRASTPRPRAIPKRSGQALPASSSGRGRGTTVLDWQPPHAKWFVGGTLNASVNCLDRHVRGPRRNKAALIWEGEPGDRRTLTYFDLHRAGLDVRERAEVARRAQGRPRRASTCRSCPSSRSRCSPARASAPCTASCSAASAPSRCATASTTRSAAC